MSPSATVPNENGCRSCVRLTSEPGLSRTLEIADRERERAARPTITDHDQLSLQNSECCVRYGEVFLFLALILLPLWSISEANVE